MAAEIQAYMPAANGGRRRSFKVDGVEVFVEPNEDDERGRAVAEFLARAPDVVARLRAENRDLRAELPPKKPARLLAEGTVRMRDGRIWLLGNRSKGWGSFGFLLESWDDLFRRYDVIVTGYGEDEAGAYWTVDNTRESHQVSKEQP